MNNSIELEFLSKESSPISRLPILPEISANDLFILERIDDIKSVDVAYESNNVDSSTLKNVFINSLANGSVLKLMTAESTTDSFTIDVSLENMLNGIIELLRYEDSYNDGGAIHESIKITYSDLSAQLLNDISAKLDLKSMAYKEHWEYAKKSHAHDYSLVRCYPYYTSADVLDAYDPNVKIMSFNIHNGLNSSNIIDLDTVVYAITKYKPEVVCLQLIDNNTNRSGHVNLALIIKNKLIGSWNYTFSNAFSYDGGEHGLAMLYLQSPKTSYKKTLTSDLVNDLQRIALILEFETYVIVNTHLASGTTATAETQIEELLDFIESKHYSKPIFLCGSINATMTSNVIKKIMTKFILISDSSIPTTTTSTVDYVFVDSAHYVNCKNIDYTVATDIIISNHYPIIAKFAYGDPLSIDEYIGNLKIWELVDDKYLSVDHLLYRPHIKFELYSLPDIGEIRFMGWKSFPTKTTTNPKKIGINGSWLLYDSEYDGFWSYTNGQTITCNADEFTDACRIFGNNAKDGRDTSFTVPLLSNFVKLNPGVNKTNAVQKNNYHNGSLKKHKHQLDDDVFTLPDNRMSCEVSILTYANSPKKNVDLVIPVPSGVDFSKYKYFIHSGSVSDTKNADTKVSKVTELTATLNISNAFNSKNCNSDAASIDIETKPYHNLIPTIVYLGRSSRYSLREPV